MVIMHEAIPSNHMIAHYLHKTVSSSTCIPVFYFEILMDLPADKTGVLLVVLVSKVSYSCGLLIELQHDGTHHRG